MKDSNSVITHNTLGYYWRVFKAGFCFLTFGIGALGLAFLILPLIAIFSTNPEQRCKRSRFAIHLSWRFFVFLMSICKSIKVEIRNIEKLKNLQGHIIVANHPSLIDIVILISLIPQADCVVKGALANNFFMRHIVKSLYITNSLNFDEILSKCSQSLKKGNNLIVFPEGTRTVPGHKKTISRGTAHIAINSCSNILPITINCFPHGLMKNQKWYNVPAETMNFTIQVKDPINISDYLPSENDRPIAARRLTEKIAQILEIA